MGKDRKKRQMKKQKCKHSILHITELYNIQTKSLITTRVKCKKCGKLFPEIAKVHFSRIKILGDPPFVFNTNQFKTGD